MSAITALVFGGALFTLAPVPPDAPADPMGRGYMGITIETGGVTVSRVEPKMPAEKAGLRGGDVLIRIGNVEARDTDQVISHICSFRPGAVVEIEVQRGGERKTFKVTLGCRPLELDEQSRYPLPRPIEP